MSRTVQERAAVALAHIDRLRRHLVRGSMDDELIFDAVAMCLASAIEELSALNEAVLRQHFGDTWFHIKATRNAIAHNYAFVDEPRLADTIVDELPGFESVLRGLLRSN